MEIDKQLCEVFRHLLSTLWGGVKVDDVVLKRNIEMNLLAGIILELDRHEFPEIEKELGDYVDRVSKELDEQNSSTEEETSEDVKSEDEIDGTTTEEE